MNEKKLIESFFELEDRLKDASVLKSTRHLGDIAEFLCADLYNLTLSKSKIQEGYDAKDKKKVKYQIKINNSSERTNQPTGAPDEYDFLLLVVTKNSKLWQFSNSDTYFATVYRIKSKELQNKKYVGKRFLEGHTPEYIFNKSFKLINPK